MREANKAGTTGLAAACASSLFGGGGNFEHPVRANNEINLLHAACARLPDGRARFLLNVSAELTYAVLLEFFVALHRLEDQFWRCVPDLHAVSAPMAGKLQACHLRHMQR